MQHQWWQGSVVYQIYPMSFQDSNNDGVGDLPGITSRLDYIKQLGVDVIWLNPIYKSPNKDNGYDIADYKAINPLYGDMNDFNTLLKQVHEHGMKLMMDLVVNHTSDQHAWFKESRQSKDNPYADYYIWRDPVDGHEPNNWQAAFGGPAWTYVPERGQYYLHLFAPAQPDLNWENPDVRQAVFDIERFWLDKGVDGFRMDVINLISKQPGLPDVPGEATAGTTMDFVADGPRLNEFLHQMNEEVLSHYDVMTVGEMPGSTPEDAIKYTGLKSEELNMVFQFEHVGLSANPDVRLGKWNDQPVKLTELKDSLNRWEQELDGKGWNSLYWNNHDQPRAVSRFANDDPAVRVRAAKMLGTALHMLQGTPYVYEGEELGMTNAHFTSLSQYRDLESLNGYKEMVEEKHLVSSSQMMKDLANISRDNARTPMQWSTAANAGFSEHTPWSEMNTNYPEINVAVEENDQDSVLKYYQKLIALRHGSDLIKFGDFEALDADDDQVYAYKRHYDGHTLLVMCNFTNDTVTRDYHQGEATGELIGNYADDQGVTLRPYESKVYEFDEK
ncbi:glycoside hydrolase family 13 protein [Furfurilactobacillus rossiae]|uniref:Oligo-1,6-glucosidase n=1 Tax=Furfurilactobacillus rossiae DSM 15814 TaxID=1114972 RepID=A0A0R1RHD1_9LACO|nr:alpha-glucosidase [Furfurilactobacillus rossiae]KRL55785.1 oligo-1,6-glucosidase [Furfurilactobacillus rossiae DSM 15814]QFR67266.1 alpha,alpha-phosphotrehalase [Furfurilactobacillus rossiae]QLE60191.1 Oligo-16-glucosidase [Furfurilactobacillus rossiae]